MRFRPQTRRGIEDLVDFFSKPIRIGRSRVNQELFAPLIGLIALVGVIAVLPVAVGGADPVGFIATTVDVAAGCGGGSTLS